MVKTYKINMFNLRKIFCAHLLASSALSLALSSALSLAFANTALAYIPSAQTIISRTQKAHGKGAYQIDQDVVLPFGIDVITVHERWVIDPSEAMRLTVFGPKQGKFEPTWFEASYRKNTRTSADAIGLGKDTPISAEFIEPFFHTRTSKSFIDAMVRAKIVPARFTTEKPRFNRQSPDAIPAPQEFVRLGRSGGVVTYAFGEPTVPGSNRPLPGVWLEQDQFIVRRVRFANDAEVRAEKFTIAENGLRFPLDRSVRFGVTRVQIHTTSIKTLTPQTAVKLLTADITTASQLPNDPAIAEFYSRFR